MSKAQRIDGIPNLGGREVAYACVEENMQSRDVDSVLTMAYHSSSKFPKGRLCDPGFIGAVSHERNAMRRSSILGHPLWPGFSFRAEYVPAANTFELRRWCLHAGQKIPSTYCGDTHQSTSVLPEWRKASDLYKKWWRGAKQIRTPARTLRRANNQDPPLCGW